MAIPDPVTFMLTLFPQYSKTALKILLISAPILFSSILAGCSISSPSVNFNATPTQVSAPAALPQVPVALIYSEQTMQTQREMATYQSHYRDGRLSWLYVDDVRNAYIQTSSPDFSTHGVDRVLTQHFGTVEAMRSMPDAMAKNFQLIVVLDVQTRLINHRSSEPASAITLHFYGKDLNPLGGLTASSQRFLTPMWAGSKRLPEIVADIQQQGAVQSQTLESLGEQLTAVPFQ